MDDFLSQIEEVVELEPGTANASDCFKEYENWDSLASLMLLTQIEEQYGIAFNNSDLMKVDTLEDLYNMIQERTANN